MCIYLFAFQGVFLVQKYSEFSVKYYRMHNLRMWDVRVCAACLATDVRMFSMSSYSSCLLQPYQLLSGRELTEDMPQQLCWECAALVNKFNLFRHKCERAHLLLQDLYNQHDEITEDAVKRLDRFQHNLVSSHTISQSWNDTLKSNTIKAIKHSKKESIDQEFEIKLVKEEISVKSEPESDVDFAEPFATELDCGMREKKKNGLKDLTVKRERRKKAKEHWPEFDATEIILTQEQASGLYTHRKNSRRYKRARHKCQLCYQGFHDKDFYDKHMRKHDPKLGLFECDFCKRRFQSRKVLRVHIGLKHTKKYICNICKKISHSRNVAKAHHLLHQKLGPVVKRRPKRKRRTKEQVTAKDFETLEQIQTQEEMMSMVYERQFGEGYRTAPFKCTLCFKAFLEPKTYNNHMLQHDPVSGEFVCDICKLRVKTRAKVHKHIMNNHLRKYTCKICSNVCYNRSSARAHYGWHNGVTYTCHICGATFGKLSSHLSHVRIKHPSDHVCGICSQSFVSPMGLYHHTRIMHSLKRDAASVTAEEDTSAGADAYCAQCDIRFTTKQAQTRHILISPKHEFERATIVNGCRICGETFDSRPELKSHRSSLHPPKFERRRRPAPWTPKPCVECGEVMMSSRKYRAHFQLKHSGEPSPFPEQTYSHMCEVCGKGFKCNSTLVIHRNLHTGAREYKCGLCPKSFFLPLNLKQHLVTHSDERPHVCGVCGKGFKLRNALRRHVRSHTGERPYDCATCGKAFPSSTGRNAHMRSVHRKEPSILSVYRRQEALP